MTTLPVADARAQLSRLIDASTTTHERFEITRNGRRAAVLMSADDYDMLQDTIAVLSDAELLTAHRAGRAALDAGDFLDADQLAHTMREAGRLPPVSDRYRLRIAGPAARALAETLPEKVATAAYEFITGPLLDDPHGVGKPLDPPMAPTWTARRGTYRVLFLLDDYHHRVEVTAIRHRADAYRT